MDIPLKVFFVFLEGDSFGTVIEPEQAQTIIQDWVERNEETEAGDHMVQLANVTSIEFFR
jgi:hypothetical protein